MGALVGRDGTWLSWPALCCGCQPAGGWGWVLAWLAVGSGVFGLVMIHWCAGPWLAVLHRGLGLVLTFWWVEPGARAAGYGS